MSMLLGMKQVIRDKRTGRLYVERRRWTSDAGDTWLICTPVRLNGRGYCNDTAFGLLTDGTLRRKTRYQFVPVGEAPAPVEAWRD